MWRRKSAELSCGIREALDRATRIREMPTCVRLPGTHTEAHMGGSMGGEKHLECQLEDSLGQEMALAEPQTGRNLPGEGSAQEGATGHKRMGS